MMVTRHGSISKRISTRCGQKNNVMEVHHHATMAWLHESAANVSEVTDSSKARLARNLREVACAATADKEHIQQMSDTADNLLIIVNKQQNQIDKLIKQNGKLTLALSVNKPVTILRNRDSERKDRRGNRKKADTPKDDHRGNHEKTDTPKDDRGCGVCGHQHKTKMLGVG